VVLASVIYGWRLRNMLVETLWKEVWVTGALYYSFICNVTLRHLKIWDEEIKIVE